MADPSAAPRRLRIDVRAAFRPNMFYPSPRAVAQTSPSMPRSPCMTHTKEPGGGPPSLINPSRKLRAPDTEAHSRDGQVDRPHPSPLSSGSVSPRDRVGPRPPTTYGRERQYRLAMSGVKARHSVWCLRAPTSVRMSRQTTTNGPCERPEGPRHPSRCWLNSFGADPATRARSARRVPCDAHAPATRSHPRPDHGNKCRPSRSGWSRRWTRQISARARIGEFGASVRDVPRGRVGHLGQTLADVADAVR